MRIITVIKFIAAIAVLSALAATLVLAERFFSSDPEQEAPSNKLEALIPAKPAPVEEVEQLVEKLEVDNLPDVTPGERAFESARELLTVGDYLAAEEKLKYVTTYYPTAPSAKEARRILGEMNMDRLFSGVGDSGQKTYTVQRGDSFLKIARENQTNLDLIRLLNGLDRVDRLHPGDELIVMPLNLRLVVDVRQELIELWKGSQYIKAYDPMIMQVPKGQGSVKTKISDVEAKADGRVTNSSKTNYRSSEKIFVFAKPQMVIRSPGDYPKEGFEGVILSDADIEELALLLRSGNSVEIRY
ncbi:LysM domain-containing protein [Rubritalea squalenifaciens DSM 18772]|uniref:LysM domain-containing protein n=1 Tax=Rubritalea squalenifaciens DSM 18772 TaxID=1123071 RepID=A0A1M6I111_9BACT|nr:LysM peptidoglycan-binding domain-containing protein [Rubritalea squalenifaciens]SHJ27934.1 LysM domain-containing protein [Rubritalea squalenifaciens DSM 18772]